MQLYVWSRTCLFENFPPSFHNTDLFCVKTVRNHVNRSGLPIFQQRFCGATGSSLLYRHKPPPHHHKYTVGLSTSAWRMTRRWPSMRCPTPP